MGQAQSLRELMAEDYLFITEECSAMLDVDQCIYNSNLSFFFVRLDETYLERFPEELRHPAIAKFNKARLRLLDISRCSKIDKEYSDTWMKLNYTADDGALDDLAALDTYIDMTNMFWEKSYIDLANMHSEPRPTKEIVLFTQSYIIDRLELPLTPRNNGYPGDFDVVSFCPACNNKEQAIEVTQ
jgi:hypothetical protein